MHFFSDLPPAAAWTRVKNGNYHAADTFKWLARWWAEIGGWAASVVNIAVAGILLAKGVDDGDTGSTYTYCTNTWGGSYWGSCSDYTYANGWTIMGGSIITYEIIGWIMYYVYRHGAYRYADYLESQLYIQYD